MGSSGDRTLVPVHAHINLLGFTLMSIFGLVYRAFPAMAATTLAPVHFWLHFAGAFVLLVMLFLYLTGRVTEAAMFPIAPIAEVAIFASLLIFVFNLWKNAR